jgi:CheY-like chemotaxis protein
VYGIVTQLDGQVLVSSQVDVGTCFDIYLPRSDATAASAPQAEDQPDGAMVGGSETLLLVEDEGVVRSLVRQMLTDLGYRVLVAPDGERALDLEEGHDGSIDLLVTDVVMPKLDGRALAEQLAAVRPGLRILFLSGYTGDVIGRLPEGTAFLEKPFTEELLARKVREMLDSERGS